MSAFSQHILVALDLAPHSLRVLHKAEHLAKLFGAKLSLVHVIERGIEADHIYVDLEEYDKQTLNEAHNKLDSIMKQTPHGEAIQKEDQHIVFGAPKDVILSTTDQLGCDLIMVGSHSRQGLRRLMGSTANYIVQQAKRDVYVVWYNQK